MKYLCLILPLLCCFSFADNKVELEIETCVDPVLNLERIDSQEKLDVFSNPTANFRITYNGQSSVEVQFCSKDDWKLMERKDKSKIIEYECAFNDEVNDGCRYDVPHTDFSDGKYEFSTTIRQKNPRQEPLPGQYSGSFTIAVTEKS